MVVLKHVAKRIAGVCHRSFDKTQLSLLIVFKKWDFSGKQILKREVGMWVMTEGKLSSLMQEGEDLGSFWQRCGIVAPLLASVARCLLSNKLCAKDRSSAHKDPSIRSTGTA